jgi:hypothetical protein
MITSKHTRCSRFVWAYVTRYAYVSAQDIAGAQSTYDHREVTRALESLERCGYIRGDSQSMHGRFVAVVPFVVDVPEWAV